MSVPLASVTDQMLPQHKGPVRLRDYQSEAIAGLRAKGAAGHRRLVLSAPTGAGKTEIAMSMLQSVAAKGNTAWFVVDRTVLVNQTSRRFSAAGIPHGTLQAGNTRGTTQPVVIVSKQTADRRGWWDADPPDVLMIDECHVQQVPRTVIDRFAAADTRILGLTATPYTDVLNGWDAIVNTATTQSLTAAGHLVPLRPYVPEESHRVDVQGIKVVSGGEWHRPSLSQAVEAVSGHIVEDFLEHVRDPRTPTIVFLPRIVDCMLFASLFSKAGAVPRLYTASYGNGYPTEQEKQAAIDGFADGSVTMLLTCNALTRGFDAPNARVMIDANPIRKAWWNLPQRIGRVIRSCPGKSEAILIDHANNYLGHLPRLAAHYTEGPIRLPSEHESDEHVYQNWDAATVDPELLKGLDPAARRLKELGGKMREYRTPLDALNLARLPPVSMESFLCGAFRHALRKHGDPRVAESKARARCRYKLKELKIRGRFQELRNTKLCSDADPEGIAYRWWRLDAESYARGLRG